TAGNLPPEGYVDRALAKLELSDYTGAKADAERALADRTASNRAQARAYMARAQSAIPRAERGAQSAIVQMLPPLADLNESLRLDPDYGIYRLDKAEVLYRQAQPDAARVELETLLGRSPDAAPADRLLGLVYMMLAEPDQAQDPLGKAADLYS